MFDTLCPDVRNMVERFSGHEEIVKWGTLSVAFMEKAFTSNETPEIIHGESVYE